MPIHQPLPETPCYSPFGIVIRKLTYMLELVFAFKPSPVSGFLLTVLKLDVGVIYHVLGALSLCHGDPCLWMPPAPCAEGYEACSVVGGLGYYHLHIFIMRSSTLRNICQLYTFKVEPHSYANLSSKMALST